MASGEAVYAAELKVGSMIATPKGASAVTAVSTAMVETYKAPLTASGTVTIGGVHASIYAEMKSHSLAHFALGPVRMAQQFFGVAADQTPATAPPMCPNVVS